jgi:hypothetical protein
MYKYSQTGQRKGGRLRQVTSEKEVQFIRNFPWQDKKNITFSIQVTAE